MLRALQHRNYRMYFAGQAVSILGTWIQQVAMGWLVYRLTGSPAMLGLIAFLSQIPQLLVGPIAGVLLDRVDRRWVLFSVQALMAVQAFVLAVLTYTDLITPSWLIGLAAVLGLLNAFDSPTRQSLLSLLIDDRDDLPNAIALNATLMNCGRFIGPPIAGAIVGLTGEAACFAVNGLSFAALMTAAWRMRPRPQPKAAAAQSAAQAFGEGFQWIAHHRAASYTIGLTVAINLLVAPYASQMPVFARDVYGGGPQTMGLLLGAAGCGSFLAAVTVASRRAGTVLIGWAAMVALLAGLALTGFTRLGWLPGGMLLLAMMGYGITGCNVSCNTTLQAITPEHLRGRVIAWFTSSVWGMQAIGGLIIGQLASEFGAPDAMSVASLAAALLATWVFSQRRKLRQDVQKLRITAAELAD